MRGSNVCGGSCDAESTCPPGTACELESTDGDLEIYACRSPAADLGEPCTSDAECDPNASSLGVFCCMDAARCGMNLNQCVENCSTFSSGGVVQMVEGEICEDNTQCGEGLFCCLVPDAAGNCNFDLDQSCTCRGDASL